MYDGINSFRYIGNIFRRISWQFMGKSSITNNDNSDSGRYSRERGDGRSQCDRFAGGIGRDGTEKGGPHGGSF